MMLVEEPIIFKVHEPDRLEKRNGLDFYGSEMVQVPGQTSYAVAGSMKEIVERFPKAHLIERLGPFIDIRHER